MYHDHSGAPRAYTSRGMADKDFICIFPADESCPEIAGLSGPTRSLSRVLENISGYNTYTYTVCSSGLMSQSTSRWRTIGMRGCSGSASVGTTEESLVHH